MPSLLAGRLPGGGRDIILEAMSTLAEIEAAVPNLNPEELEHLVTRLQEIRQKRVVVRQAGTNLAEFAGVLRLTEDPLDWQHRVRSEWE